MPCSDDFLLIQRRRLTNIKRLLLLIILCGSLAIGSSIYSLVERLATKGSCLACIISTTMTIIVVSATVTIFWRILAMIAKSTKDNISKCMSLEVE